MLPILAVASGDGGIAEALVSYGIAFPFALVCLATARWAISDRDRKVAAAEEDRDRQIALARQERDAERARTEKMTEQMITLQGQALPLLSEAATVIRATGRQVG